MGEDDGVGSADGVPQGGGILKVAPHHLDAGEQLFASPYVAYQCPRAQTMALCSLHRQPSDTAWSRRP